MNAQELRESLSTILDERFAESISLNIYAQNADAQDFNEWKKTFVGAFLLKYPDGEYILDHVSKGLGSFPSWDKFTKVNLNEIKKYICSCVSPNSAKTYCACIASVLRDFSDEGVVPCRESSIPLCVRAEPSQHTYLTYKEIQLIHEYEPQSEVERTVKRWFLLECYTGARTSDARLLSEKNIRGGKLYYISKKTKIESCVPIHKNLLKYLHAPEDEKEHNKSVVNNTLKKICQTLGINKTITLFVAGKSQTKEKWEFISTHTARRSFATNLALAGEKIAVISAYMGHKSIDMTSRYIVVDPEEIEVNRFFL